MQDHHGSGEDPELRRALSRMTKNSLGEFPDGKLDDTDEGAIPIGVGHVSGRVKITFPKPIAWTAMPPGQALELAELLILHAKRASGFDPEFDAQVAELRSKLDRA
jgi:hypothetical protein